MTKGLSYPLEVNPATGNLRTESGAELISGHIISMLETEPLESPMRPSYGVPSNLFESVQNYQAYAADVRRRLEREIPQATFQVVGELGEDGAAMLLIDWSFEEQPQETLAVALT